MILLACNVAATFAVFSAVCWQLYRVPHPKRRTVMAVGEWLLWLLVHLAIALPMLIVLVNQAMTLYVPGVHVVIYKLALTVLILAPWRLGERKR